MYLYMNGCLVVGLQNCIAMEQSVASVRCVYIKTESIPIYTGMDSVFFGIGKCQVYKKPARIRICSDMRAGFYDYMMKK